MCIYTYVSISVMADILFVLFCIPVVILLKKFFISTYVCVCVRARAYIRKCFYLSHDVCKYAWYICMVYMHSMCVWYVWYIIEVISLRQGAIKIKQQICTSHELGVNQFREWVKTQCWLTIGKAISSSYFLTWSSIDQSVCFGHSVCWRSGAWGVWVRNQVSYEE